MDFDFLRILGWVLLALGFGFVIFWHELGHFIAAKWAGVKVEQFAVGFGTAAMAWRKGIGVVLGGSTTPKVEARIHQERELRRSKVEKNAVGELEQREETDDQIRERLGIGETEYRLNWLPLGGYVKMLGQDDLHPNSEVTDPRAYNMQPISKRMVIVSAGVIMNILLAGIGFCVLFLYGFNAPPSIVGSVMPLSPAQQAGLNVGDRIVSIDEQPQYDFTKIFLTTALLPDGRDVPLVYRTPDGKEVHSTVRAARMEGDPRGMLQLGITPAIELATIKPNDRLKKELTYNPATDPPEFNQFHPGEVITAVGDTQIVDPETLPKEARPAQKSKDLALLDAALQQSNGAPVTVTVTDAQGKTRQEKLQPTLSRVFGDDALDFAGMAPRAVVNILQENSVALNELKPNDIILAIQNLDTGDDTPNPSIKILMDRLDQAGKGERAVKLTVLRDGQVVEKTLKPTLKVARDRYGLGVQLAADEEHAVIGSVEEKTAAQRAGLPQGATILSVDGKPVSSWYDVLRLFRQSKADVPMKIAFRPAGGANASADLTLSADDIERLKGYRYMSLALHSGMFRDRTEPRKTSNPLQAAAWGAGETRDLIVQFYITLKRMAQRSVPASNLMGPYGIVKAGAGFADRGTDWLIWFLAMISANLAVVNFLPIPIVDGGLFLFLIIEKLQGKPISARAQSIAQVVGLALILSVFIFVTYQDIVR